MVFDLQVIHIIRYTNQESSGIHQSENHLYFVFQTSLLNFISHNILLPDGGKTMEDRRPLLSRTRAWLSIKESLDQFLPAFKENVASSKVVDLGCLEGGYAVEFARLGYQTLGIEARVSNLDKCLHVKEKLDLPNLDFVQNDARDLDHYGPFDIVLCYGILYHLDDPVAFLKKVFQQTKRMLLLHTHYAPEGDWRYNLGLVNRYVIAPIQNRTHLFEHAKNYQLSRLTTHEGYRGRWYTEWRSSSSPEKIEGKSLSSYNNPKSFWLCRTDLTKALSDVGFRHVFERFDHVGKGQWTDYPRFYSRSMFIALK